MSNKKLLFVHDHRFFKTKGGDYYSEGKLPRSAFKRFSRVSRSISVLCRSVEVESAEGLVISSSDSVQFFPVSGDRWSTIFGKNLFANLRLIISLIDKADLVAIRLPCFFSFLIFPLVLIKRKNYAVEVVGDAFEAIYNAGGNKFIYKVFGGFFDLYTKSVVYGAVGAIYVTKNELQKKYKTKGVVAYASNVSIPEVSGEVIEERIKRIDSISNRDKIKVGVIGSFNNNYKGIDVLISSIARVREALDVDVDLHILGTGKKSILKPSIDKSSAHEWVFFDGRKSSDDVVLWLDGIDLYCQPSRTEGLPRSLIEAMSRGCPAIASSVGGIPELLPETRLAQGGNVGDLAEKISDLLGDPGRLAKDANRNFEVAKDYYREVLEEKRQRFWQDVSEKYNA